MPALLVFVAVFAGVGHIGKEVVESKCNLEYFVPEPLFERAVFFVALTPIDGFFDSLEGLTSGWSETCPKVRRQQDPAVYSGRRSRIDRTPDADAPRSQDPQ